MSDFQKGDKVASESLINLIVDKTFKNHKLGSDGSVLSKEEADRLMETVKILQGQAEKFLTMPSKRIVSEGTGASKFVPKNRRTSSEDK